MEQSIAKQIEVVAGLIFHNQKLLVCQRRCNAVFGLKWEFPGGKLEQGESHRSALCRELKEELDIDAGEMRLVHRQSHRYPGGPVVSLRFFHVIDYRGDVKNLVFEQIVWSKPAELLNFDFLDGDLPLVRRLAKGEIRYRLDGGELSNT